MKYFHLFSVIICTGVQISSGTVEAAVEEGIEAAVKHVSPEQKSLGNLLPAAVVLGHSSPITHQPNLPNPQSFAPQPLTGPSSVNLPSKEQGISPSLSLSRLRKIPTLQRLHGTQARTGRSIEFGLQHPPLAADVQQQVAGPSSVHREPPADLPQFPSLEGKQGLSNDLFGKTKSPKRAAENTDQSISRLSLEQRPSASKRLKAINENSIEAQIEKNKGIYGHIYTPGKPKSPAPVFTDAYYRDLQISVNRWAKAFKKSDETVKDAFRFVSSHQPLDYFERQFGHDRLTKAEFTTIFEEYIRYATLDYALRDQVLDVQERAEFWQTWWHQKFKNSLPKSNKV